MQIAGLANIASNYLIAGEEGSRYGTGHPSVVPYQVFPCKDGFLMIGAGNNKQVRLDVLVGEKRWDQILFAVPTVGRKGAGDAMVGE